MQRIRGQKEKMNLEREERGKKAMWQKREWRENSGVRKKKSQEKRKGCWG